AQYAEIPKVIKSGAENPGPDGAEMPEAIRQGIISAVDETIVPAKLISAVITALESQLSDEDIDTMLNWYQSDLAKRITGMENAASTPEAMKNVQTEIETLMNSDSRVLQARKIDTLTGSSEFAVEIQMFTQLAMVSAIANALGPQAGIDLEMLKTQMLAQKPAVQAQIQQMSTATYVYTYRDLEESELKEYVKFLELPVSQRFITNVMGATKTEMQTMITAFTKKLAEAFQAEQMIMQ
ncbi:MAG: DUF2059 domain-containing protein, partial [Candidatus Omnitrophica bacterium]|nr:DUF2059 domain-containing protein [Candidatus Omnitrophota bacterium]